MDDEASEVDRLRRELSELRDQLIELTGQVALNSARLDAIHGATARPDVRLYVVGAPEETPCGSG